MTDYLIDKDRIQNLFRALRNEAVAQVKDIEEVVGKDDTHAAYKTALVEFGAKAKTLEETEQYILGLLEYGYID